MSVDTPSRRRWIGRYLIVVALIHLAAAGVLYSAPLTEMASKGLIATADDHSPRAAAYWFIAFAPMLAVVGLLIDQGEAQGRTAPLAAVIVLAAALTAMIAVMPATGAWLLIPPVAALLLRARRHTA